VNPLLRDADGGEPPGVLLAAGRDGGEGAEAAAEERTGGAEPADRPLREAPARHEDWQAPAPRRPEEDGPELGLHQDEEARSGRIEEAADRDGEVEGKRLKPRRRGEVAESLLEEADAGRGRRCDEERELRTRGAEGERERVGQLDLADRDSLHPDVDPPGRGLGKEPSREESRQAGSSGRRAFGPGQPASLEEVTFRIREAAL
jgi:hypothetical protein